MKTFLALALFLSVGSVSLYAEAGLIKAKHYIIGENKFLRNGETEYGPAYKFEITRAIILPSEIKSRLPNIVRVFTNQIAPAVKPGGSVEIYFDMITYDNYNAKKLVNYIYGNRDLLIDFVMTKTVRAFFPEGQDSPDIGYLLYEPDYAVFQIDSKGEKVSVRLEPEENITWLEKCRRKFFPTPLEQSQADPDSEISTVIENN